MIIIQILTGSDAGKSIDVSDQNPKEFLNSFLAKNIDWEIDYSAATPEEQVDWLAKDLSYRLIRAFNRKLPVTFFGEIYHDFKELEVPMQLQFAVMKHFGDRREPSIIKDDETGLEIDARMTEGEAKTYEECIKKRGNFRQNKLTERHFIRFIQNEIKEKFSQNSNLEVLELLDYATQSGVKFSRTFLSELLSAVIKQGTDRKLAFLLRELIRTSIN